MHELLGQGAVVADTRAAAEYAAGHLRGTLSIPLDYAFVTWAGWLLPYGTDLYFIVDDPSDSRLEELVRQLALIGLDQVAGVSARTRSGASPNAADRVERAAGERAGARGPKGG